MSRSYRNWRDAPAIDFARIKTEISAFLKIIHLRNHLRIKVFPEFHPLAPKKVRNESPLSADNYYVGTTYRAHESSFNKLKFCRLGSGIAGRQGFK
jgi:hypothetical protein